MKYFYTLCSQQHALENYFGPVKKYISSYLFLLPCVPSSGLWKVIIIFLFPLILCLHKKPLIHLVLISNSEGKTKEYSENHTLLPWRGSWADNVTVAWHGLCKGTDFHLSAPPTPKDTDYQCFKLSYSNSDKKEYILEISWVTSLILMGLYLSSPQSESRCVPSYYLNMFAIPPLSCLEVALPS